MITWITRKPWRAVAVSRIGVAHVQSNIPCQDSCSYLIESDTLIACVGDGAGSSRYSDKGSRAAVDRFVTASQELLKSSDGRNLIEIVSTAFEEARLAVAEVADDSPREYATTLLGLIATGRDVAAIQIGDGAIIVDGDVVMDSDSGEYANETRFITEHGATPNTFSASRRIRRVALMTDGLDNLALENNGYQRVPHKPFFDPLFSWLQRSDEPDKASQLGEFLASERVRARTTDDVTLLLAMR